MDIEVLWSKPVPLRDGWEDDLIYTLDELDELPEGPGVYVFARIYAGKPSPLYIGRATQLAQRVRGQLNNTRLMRQIQKAPSGMRALLVGQLQLKGGQQAGRALDILEPALIEYALGQGHDLLNVQGTRLPVHHIRSRGSRAARAVVPPYLQRRRRR